MAKEPVQLAPQEYLGTLVELQEDLLKFLKRSFGWSLAVTVPVFLAVIFLDGWQVAGFDTSDAIIIFLGTTTLGEIAGLFTTAIVTFFKPS